MIRGLGGRPEVGLAGMAHLSLVLESREHVGPPQQVDIGVRVDIPDFFDEILEPNHELWCLSPTRGAGPWSGLTTSFSVHYTDPVRAPAILAFVPFRQIRRK